MSAVTLPAPASAPGRLALLARVVVWSRVRAAYRRCADAVQDSVDVAGDAALRRWFGLRCWRGLSFGCGRRVAMAAVLGWLGWRGLSFGRGCGPPTVVVQVQFKIPLTPSAPPRFGAGFAGTAGVGFARLPAPGRQRPQRRWRCSGFR